MSEHRAGRFTEGLEYTVGGAPLKPPIWKPAKPDPRWTITPEQNLESATATHPDHPKVIFRWNSKTNNLNAKIQWQDGPVYVESIWHICALPPLFSEFMTVMMQAAETPIHKFPNDNIITY